MIPSIVQSENQKISHPLLEEKGISLYVKREDRIHPLISGNKFRKLKYNVEEAKRTNLSTLLTFGGAYSNHIIATACAAKENSLQSIGVIRGEELAFLWQENPTLTKAAALGMQLKFIARSEYREKHSSTFNDRLKEKFGEFYLLPEGGTNDLAVKGCTEILTENDLGFDVVCSSVGTGGTIAGIINASAAQQQIIGFPALKGDFLKEDIRKFAFKSNWSLQNDYHFGGYAKVTALLIEFMNDFRSRTQIPLDPVYTAKMMYGIFDMVKKGLFKPHTKILAIHTGGLQGIQGMNLILGKKKLPLIEV